MAGLFLHGTAGAQVGATPQMPNVSGTPSSVAEAAWGHGNAVAPGGGVTSLMPTNPTGIAFWSGVAGLTFLLVLRHSLPR